MCSFKLQKVQFFIIKVLCTLQHIVYLDPEQIMMGSNSTLTEDQGSENAGYVPEDNVFLENSVEQPHYVDPNTKL